MHNSKLNSNSYNTYIRFRLTDEQKKHLRQKADTLGMSISAYLRYLIVKNIEHDPHPSYLIFENFNEIFEKMRKLNRQRGAIKFLRERNLM